MIEYQKADGTWGKVGGHGCANEEEQKRYAEKMGWRFTPGIHPEDKAMMEKYPQFTHLGDR